MLQQNLKEATSTEQLHNAKWPYVNSANSAHFAGTFNHFVSQVKTCFTLPQHQWIVDSGATDHITPYLHLLTDVTTCSSTLSLPNGQSANITHMGSLYVNEYLTLTNILCVPDFAYNLLSIPKLLETSKYLVYFSPDK